MPTGTGAFTVDLLVASGFGVMTIGATGDIPVAVPTSTGSGVVPPIGPGAFTVNLLTTAGTGLMIPGGVGDIPIGPPEVSGPGLVDVNKGVIPLPIANVSGAGGYLNGAGTLIITPVITSGVGNTTYIPPVLGTGAIIIAPNIVQGLGETEIEIPPEPITGTGILNVSGAVVSAIGEVIPPEEIVTNWVLTGYQDNTLWTEVDQTLLDTGTWNLITFTD